LNMAFLFLWMHLDRYPVITGKDSMTFEFTSEGRFGKVEKMVDYTPFGAPGFYNLCFGDKNSVTGVIDDLVVTNNGDSKKVLATVASTLYTFTEAYPDALIFAKGATIARTRLYRMGIANNYDMIKNDFKILGSKNGCWLPFQKNIEFDQFLAKRGSIEEDVNKFVFMENKPTYGKGAIIIGINPELDKYKDHPLFKKRADEALETLIRYGVPEEFRLEWEVGLLKADKSIRERYYHYKKLRQTSPSSTPSAD
jgi:hypothetical protein